MNYIEVTLSVTFTLHIVLHGLLHRQQVPPARSLKTQGDGLAAGDLNDSIQPTAGVELYTAAAMVFFFHRANIFPGQQTKKDLY